jgi:hypothetical protein
MKLLTQQRIEMESSRLRVDARRQIQEARSRFQLGQVGMEHQIQNNLEAAFIGRSNQLGRYQSYPLRLDFTMGSGVGA